LTPTSLAAPSIPIASLRAPGVEFTNGDQPGVRLTKIAAAHSVEPANALKPTVAVKAVPEKTAKATEKKR
jgi:hypothetical protein